MDERKKKKREQREWVREKRNERGRERDNDMKETDTVLWAECDRVRDGLVRRH